MIVKYILTKLTILYNTVMKLENKELILFDLDGTLIDSALDLAQAVNYTLETIGRDTFDESTIRNWVGNGAQTLVKRGLVGQRDIENITFDDDLFENALKIFLDYYSKHLAVKTQMYPNVKETLEVLHKDGYRLAIITNKPYDFIKPILDGLGIENLFELYIGGDSLDVKKPDPMPLTYVANKLDVSLEKCVMVGDSKNDILAAKSASIDSIGVTYGYNYGQSIEVFNPTIVVEGFGQIKQILKR